jgi:hypothetical protein
VKLLLCLLLCAASLAGQSSLGFLNKGRSVLDAHNCYPDGDNHADRLQRALATGRPVGIEQDLAWSGRPVVTHAAETTGEEPALRDYFFEQVRPAVERALAENRRETWPLIIVHFDFKDNRPELHDAVWELLGEYEEWITTAVKTEDASRLSALEAKPLLVLTEDNDAQEEAFFGRLATGERLRIFGSAHTNERPGAGRAPESMLTERPTNYRRWWNNSWAAVEEGGQAQAGEWTEADAARLGALVNHAHGVGFWKRFYKLNWVDVAPAAGYNIGSMEAARVRWQAAVDAGVDLIATDQYEELGEVLRGE